MLRFNILNFFSKEHPDQQVTNNHSSEKIEGSSLQSTNRTILGKQTDDNSGEEINEENQNGKEDSEMQSNEFDEENELNKVISMKKN